MKIIRLSLCLGLLWVTACKRLDQDRCRAACLRYRELAFLHQHVKEARQRASSEGRPAEEAALLAQAQAAWTAQASQIQGDSMVETCTSQCTRRGTEQHLQCIGAARTFAEAARCNTIE